jgi:hypothetical protein
MEQEIKIERIKGVKWELHPPFCELCGAHMGEMYNVKRGWKNPYNHESYGDNTCPICFQKYEYVEGDRMVLSEDDLKLLRHARARGGDKIKL